MLAPGHRILAAVSGGPDSVSMLYLLCDLREGLELTIEVAHLQHGIRGEEAVEDARFVAGLAERLDLIFHLKEVDLPQLKVASGKTSLEEIGRLEDIVFLPKRPNRVVSMRWQRPIPLTIKPKRLSCGSFVAQVEPASAASPRWVNSPLGLSAIAQMRC